MKLSLNSPFFGYDVVVVVVVGQSTDLSLIFNTYISDKWLRIHLSHRCHDHLFIWRTRHPFISLYFLSQFHLKPTFLSFSILVTMYSPLIHLERMFDKILGKFIILYLLSSFVQTEQQKFVFNIVYALMENDHGLRT